MVFERGASGAAILILQYLYPGCNLYIPIFGGIEGPGISSSAFGGPNGRSGRPVLNSQCAWWSFAC